MAVGTLLIILKDLLAKFIEFMYYFLKWFYLNLLPFIVIYIGIPLFVIGVLLSLFFQAGTILCIIVFSIGFYYFIKSTMINSNPTKIMNSVNNNGSLNSNNKVFKSNF